ncbi:RNA methyltransferase [Candidatus Gracilibacteria bacterium]|nr:RNA methyltransferase [Candidatus Gracilibacteria bacterium]
MSKIILLDNIRSMQNVGAIFRNADGAGFEKLVLTGYTPYPPRNDIAKTALGGENFIDWEYFQDSSEALEKIKSEGYKIWSVELCEDSIDYRELCKIQEEKVCLVMGNEVSGVSKKILSISDKKVIIPMRGKKESLNVSVAAGIVMYSVN